ncbi:MAG TPA: winged helix-turn-helix domain-containing protein [Edaphocola sp.]|nr:winged helix-turn-helix domain-containing protein [Edaphocola sp.]
MPKKRPITLGSFTYYPHKMTLCHDERTLQLSNRETEILNVFCAHINEALHRRELMRQVWEDDSISSAGI